LKIVISIGQSTLARLDRLVKEKKYANRSRAIQEALNVKLTKIERNSLRDECDKLDPLEE